MLPFRLRATYVADENSKPSHIDRDTMPSVDVFQIGHGVEKTRNAGPITIIIVNSRKVAASCFLRWAFQKLSTPMVRFQQQLLRRNRKHITLVAGVALDIVSALGLNALCRIT